MGQKRLPFRAEAAIMALGLLSLIAGIFLIAFPGLPENLAVVEDEAEAIRLMARAIEAVRSCRAASGPAIDQRTDLHRTGLLGIESSAITTSPGHLEAKRTTTNPLFAGGVARMLRQAGVQRGDAVAIGASGSFPGLIVATLCAARAMGVRALPILSLGASHWGANDPRWTALDIVRCLDRSGVLDVDLLALSLGGESDAGLDMDPEGREILRRKIKEDGAVFLEEGFLAAAVKERTRLFESHAGRAMKAFVNIGGSWADMGTDSRVLELRPGFNPASSVPLPEPGRRGVIQEMAGRGVAVIHLLYVKGLSERYGLPWDAPPPDLTAGFGVKTISGIAGRRIAAAVIALLILAGLALIARARRLDSIGR